MRWDAAGPPAAERRKTGGDRSGGTDGRTDAARTNPKRPAVFFHNLVFVGSAGVSLKANPSLAPRRAHHRSSSVWHKKKISIF